MSTNSHFHVLKGASFTKELISDIEMKIANNSDLASEHVVSNDVVHS